MNKMKRVLIFSLAYEPVIGGAEVAVKEITSRINDMEFDLVTKRFSETHKKEERINNVNVYRIDSSKLFFPIKAYLFGNKLHLQKPYEVVWSIMAAYAGFATLFFKMRFPKVKYVLTLQEGDPIGHIKRRAFFVTPLFKKIFLKADVIQVISNYLGDFARGMGYAGRVEVIPNGVDVKKFANNKNEQHRVLLKDNIVLITTSRLVEKNAVGDIIEALKYLETNVELHIVGIGPLESALKLKAKSLQLEARVKFLGFIKYEDIPNYLHEADIFIRPSLSEGMGNSFIEAMAAGLPVIATPVGGIVDFLKDPSTNLEQVATGLFCEVKNPESIAEQVKKLINNPELKLKLIENASRMVREKYEWDLVARDMKERVF